MISRKTFLLPALLAATLLPLAWSLSTVRMTSHRAASHRRGASVAPLRSPRLRSASATSRGAVEGDFDPLPIDSGPVRSRARALYKFTRPHTIRGTVLASVAGTTRALLDTPGAVASAQWGRLLPRAVIGMVALLLGNAFIVGINQIFDKDIDVLNKPFLPVASGEMSERVAWLTVGLSGIIGPAIV